MKSARSSITVIAVGAGMYIRPEIARAFFEQFDCNVELSFNTAGVTRSKVEASDGADILVTLANDLPAMRKKALIEADCPVELDYTDGHGSSDRRQSARRKRPTLCLPGALVCRCRAVSPPTTS